MTKTVILEPTPVGAMTLDVLATMRPRQVVNLINELEERLANAREANEGYSIALAAANAANLAAALRLRELTGNFEGVTA